MHPVIPDILFADRHERAIAHVQRNRRNLNAFLAQSVKQASGEMKSGGWGGHGAFLGGIYGLIGPSVGLCARSPDIGRQRQLPLWAKDVCKSHFLPKLEVESVILEVFDNGRQIRSKEE